MSREKGMDATIFAFMMFVCVVLVIIFVPAYVSVRQKEEPNLTGVPSPILFASIIAIAALFGYFSGVPVGIAIACSTEEASNLCGLTGYFISGPLCALLAAVLAPLVVWIWGNAASKSEQRDNPDDC